MEKKNPLVNIFLVVYLIILVVLNVNAVVISNNYYKSISTNSNESSEIVNEQEERENESSQKGYPQKSQMEKAFEDFYANQEKNEGFVKENLEVYNKLGEKVSISLPVLILNVFLTLINGTILFIPKLFKNCIEKLVDNNKLHLDDDELKWFFRLLFVITIISVICDIYSASAYIDYAKSFI